MKVYIANMPAQKERREHVLEQFAGKSLFETEVVKPAEASTPQASLMMTFVECVRKEKEADSECFVFCEDDHTFSEAWDEDEFLDIVRRSQAAGVELMSGGVFSAMDVNRLTDRVFSVRTFGGTQFIVIFKAAYDKILEARRYSVLDQWLSLILDTKVVMVPFVSYQYNSWTSITWRERMDMEALFATCQEQLDGINSMHRKMVVAYEDNI